MRVVTFNFGAGRTSPEELCNAPAKLDADLALLQEFDRTQAEAIEARGAEFGPGAGSDHRPLIVSVALERSIRTP